MRKKAEPVATANALRAWLISNVRHKKMNTPDDKQRLAKWLVVWWWIAFVVAAPLYLRLLWEETLLTWSQGRQMVGFSLAHLYPEILLLGLAGYALFIAWLIAAVVFLAAKKRRLARSAMTYLVLPVVAAALNFVPYDFWAKLGGVK